MAVPDDRVAAVRAFNRFYTNVIGVLRDHLLGTAYSLTEARVLYELAQREATEVATLRRDLDIDAGYLSRVLARFEGGELVVRQRSRLDGRRQVIRLTERGRAAYAELDSRSVRQIRGLLDHLDDAQQHQLTAAMEVIHSLLDPNFPPAVAPKLVLRPPRPGDHGWVVQRHGAVYAQEHGWDVSFEAAVARLVAEYATRHDARREAMWIAESYGQPVGCVFCMAQDGDTARLRLLLVEPTARGRGVGTALVEQCVRFARGAGYRRIVAWGEGSLDAAHRLYRGAGFVLTAEEPRHAFGHDLVRQRWVRELTEPRSAPVV
ncbi:bifunctional helix-turn-helix transcriptional regulator/GNAT family N-acetyltransferase [Streptoalloteichus hindustanus]|uniref:Transcriptional regulator, MarR family with acetyltransferase activity n=1 Tax=Streptoalloteichus hindustanus TaxID=2017 RepID=A0A1M5FQY3_STRHI|nr:bifunctional helix-turn-helix transcriptional regulator/GNAT family N-acetyltransferase [Streptoalloteichus hindustanus]SHF93918.1 transcriptional regulator, MarR family with acetyltransferase activity [Streptoalloteichus hindustanus]